MLLLLVLTALTACVSDADLQPDETNSVYVIEGSIETGKPARVLITKSLPLFESVYTTDLQSILVQDAEVFVSCEDQSEQLFLIKDEILPDIPVYRGMKITGETGKTYTLEVRVNQQVFRAADTMLEKIPPEKVWFSLETGSDSIGYIHLDIRDPGETSNYYRISTKRLGKDRIFQPVNQDILNDYYFNGSLFSVPLLQKSNLVYRPDTVYFRRGETVVVKLAHLSPAFYEVINNTEYEASNLANPFAIHFEAFTNIEGGAIGGWGCYSTALDTLKID